VSFVSRHSLGALLALHLAACAHAPLAAERPHAAPAARDAQLAEVFRLADANHDGKLSAAETGLDARTFQALDRDGDGFVTRAEWDAPAPLPEAGGIPTGLAGALLGKYLEATSKLAMGPVIHPKHKALTARPEAYGWGYENVAFASKDGVAIRGWYVPAIAPTRNTVVLLHGHSSTRSGWLEDGQAGMLHPAYNELLIDLRNNGESGGDTTTFGLKEADDAIAAVDWCYAHGHDRVALMGVSMGGATAIGAASRDPRPLAVVDDCTYATVRDAFTGFISLTFVPCPALIAAATLARANRELGLDLSAVDPVTEVRALAPRPLLIFHGGADPVIAPDNSRILKEAAGVPVDFLVTPGAGHGQSAVVAPAPYRERLLAFLERAFRQG
jgi:fermentation-respiration switch protein FrsA (DUF1100 family)